jgi:uncharacterized protein (DUF433 family)
LPTLPRQWEGFSLRRREHRAANFIAPLEVFRYREGMAALDWSQCPAVESVPGKRSGAWVFKDTRMPVATVFENLEAGSSIEEIIEQFHVTREQIQAVLEFAARSLDPPLPQASASNSTDAHPL